MSGLDLAALRRAREEATHDEVYAHDADFAALAAATWLPLLDRLERAERAARLYRAFWLALWPNMGQHQEDEVLEAAESAGLIRIVEHDAKCAVEECPCLGEGWTEMYEETTALRDALALGGEKADG